jgi:hypothetical protein
MNPELVLSILATHTQMYIDKSALPKHRTAPYKHFTKAVSGESKTKRNMKKASRRKNRK